MRNVSISDLFTRPLTQLYRRVTNHSSEISRLPSSLSMWNWFLWFSWDHSHLFQLPLCSYVVVYNYLPRLLTVWVDAQLWGRCGGSWQLPASLCFAHRQARAVLLLQCQNTQCNQQYTVLREGECLMAWAHFNSSPRNRFPPRNRFRWGCSGNFI